MNDDRLSDYLGHMLEAAQQACSYVEGLSRADFLADKRSQQAVILNIVIIGEAATRLLGDYSEFLSRHPQVPWRNMKGMRNRIAHGYFDIDLGIVWDTAQKSLPDLLKKLPDVLQDATRQRKNGNP